MRPKIHKCYQCGSGYLTMDELYAHMQLMQHSEPAKEGGNAGYAMALGGVAGLGAYKLFKRLRK